MKQCRICINREYKDKLFCCAATELRHAFWELFKQIPLFGRYIKPFECVSYMADKRLTGFPDTVPVMCRCSIKVDDAL